MFVNKSEYLRLVYRVKELETLLCPCEDHDWKEIDAGDSYNIIGNVVQHSKVLQCRRCLKVKVTPTEPYQQYADCRQAGAHVKEF